MLTPAPLIARLPAPLQQRLRDLGNGARDLFGAQRETQAIFDASIALLDALIAGGADHGMLARLLAEVGVARPDGRPLSRGTVSSALCRARERAAAAPAAARSRRKARHPADLRPAAAASHGAPQSAAGDCISPQRAAALRSGTQQGSARRRRSRRPGPAAGNAIAPDPVSAGPDSASGADATPPATSRTASLLNELRRQNHGTETQ